jgi:hypothetical protein
MRLRVNRQAIRVGGMVVVVAVGLSLTACGGSSGTTSPSRAAVDADGDGFSESAGDCNDHSASIHPNATPEVAACRWTRASWQCPRGSERSPEAADLIRVQVINNTCSTLSISDARVQTTVREAHGTFNFVGETWASNHVSYAPTSIPKGIGADIEVDADIVCTNRSGGGLYNVYTAEVTLDTSAGALTCETTNTHTTRFPIATGRAGFGPSASGGAVARRQ